MRNDYDDHTFGLSKAKPFSMTSVQGEKKVMRFAEVLLLFHLLTRTNDEMFRSLHS